MHLRHCHIVTSSTLKTKTVAKNLLDDLTFFLSTAIISFRIHLNFNLIWPKLLDFMYHRVHLFIVRWEIFLNFLPIWWTKYNVHLTNSYRIMTTQKPIFRLGNNNKKHFIAWKTVIIQTIQMTIKIGSACTGVWKHNHLKQYIFWIVLVCKTMFFINYFSFIFYYCMEWSPNKTKYF